MRRSRRVFGVIIVGTVLAAVAGALLFRNEIVQLQRTAARAMREPTTRPAAPSVPAYDPPLIRSISGVPTDVPQGSVQISADVSGEAITAVRFLLDGPQPLLTEDLEPPYQLAGDAGWDATRYPPGAYNLTVIARNAAGESAPATASFDLAAGGKTPRGGMAIFIDALNGNWRTETNGTTLNTVAGTVHNGKALSLTIDAGKGEAIFRAAEPIAASDLAAIRFWMHSGDARAVQLGVVLYDANGNPGPLVALPQPHARWQPVEVPLAGLGAPAMITGVGLRDLSGTAQRPIFLDDLTLEYAAADLAMLAPQTASFDGRTFRESFDGTPTAPAPWRSANWDVLVHSRDVQFWRELEPAEAAYDANCRPNATHTVTRYEDALFQCDGQLLSSINSSASGAVLFAPDHLVDFSSGEAVVRWQMSTLRTSDRDWVDIWLTPYDNLLQLPMEASRPDGQGPPRRALHLRMETPGNGSRETFFRLGVVRDFAETRLAGNDTTYDTVLTPSATAMTTFELRISRTSLRFGLPDQNLWWYDGPIDDLGWDQAVVQFSHLAELSNACDDPSCGPNTWRWDAIVIEPALPLTLIQSDVRRIAVDEQQEIMFYVPAPAGAMLRFLAIGSGIEVSFDGGEHWSLALTQQQIGTDEYHFSSYWMAVPAETRRVRIRSAAVESSSWLVRMPTLWAQR